MDSIVCTVHSKEAAIMHKAVRGRTNYSVYDSLKRPAMAEHSHGRYTLGVTRMDSNTLLLHAVSVSATDERFRH
jgi:hypothetical protein